MHVNRLAAVQGVSGSTRTLHGAQPPPGTPERRSKPLVRGRIPAQGGPPSPLSGCLKLHLLCAPCPRDPSPPAIIPNIRRLCRVFPALPLVRSSPSQTMARPPRPGPRLTHLRPRSLCVPPPTLPRPSTGGPCGAGPTGPPTAVECWGWGGAPAGSCLGASPHLTLTLWGPDAVLEAPPRTVSGTPPRSAVGWQSSPAPGPTLRKASGVACSLVRKVGA